jgi:6-phosphogluconate dehydrogenase
MQLGMIGLGRMGANMTRRLLAGGHQCVVFDRSPNAVEELTRATAVGAASVADLVKKLLSAMRYEFGGHLEQPGRSDRSAR